MMLELKVAIYLGKASPISFYWMWIWTNPSLHCIFLLYPQWLQNFKKIKVS